MSSFLCFWKPPCRNIWVLRYSNCDIRVLCQACKWGLLSFEYFIGIFSALPRICLWVPVIMMMGINWPPSFAARLLKWTPWAAKDYTQSQLFASALWFWGYIYTFPFYLSLFQSLNLNRLSLFNYKVDVGVYMILGNCCRFKWQLVKSANPKVL